MNRQVVAGILGLALAGCAQDRVNVSRSRATLPTVALKSMPTIHESINGENPSIDPRTVGVGRPITVRDLKSPPRMLAAVEPPRASSQDVAGMKSGRIPIAVGSRSEVPGTPPAAAAEAAAVLANRLGMPQTADTSMIGTPPVSASRSSELNAEMLTDPILPDAGSPADIAQTQAHDPAAPTPSDVLSQVEPVVLPEPRAATPEGVSTAATAPAETLASAPAPQAEKPATKAAYRDPLLGPDPDLMPSLDQLMPVEKPSTPVAKQEPARSPAPEIPVSLTQTEGQAEQIPAAADPGPVATSPDATLVSAPAEPEPTPQPVAEPSAAVEPAATPTEPVEQPVAPPEPAGQPAAPSEPVEQPAAVAEPVEQPAAPSAEVQAEPQEVVAPAADAATMPTEPVADSALPTIDVPRIPDPSSGATAQATEQVAPSEQKPLLSTELPSPAVVQGATQEPVERPAAPVAGGYVPLQGFDPPSAPSVATFGVTTRPPRDAEAAPATLQDGSAADVSPGGAFASPQGEPGSALNPRPGAVDPGVAASAQSPSAPPVSRTRFHERTSPSGAKVIEVENPVPEVPAMPSLLPAPVKTAGKNGEMLPNPASAGAASPQSAPSPAEASGPEASPQIADPVNSPVELPPLNANPGEVERGGSAALSPPRPSRRRISGFASVPVEAPNSLQAKRDPEVMRASDGDSDPTAVRSQVVPRTAFEAGRPAARVGDDVITLHELKVAITNRRRMMPTSRPLTSEERYMLARSVLNDLIDRLVIIQEAKRELKNPKQLKLFMEKADEIWMEQELPPLMRQTASANIHEVREKLTKQGESLDEIREQFRQEFLSRGYIEQKLGPRMSVHLPEMRSYYQSHLKDFNRPAQVTWREVVVEVSKHKDRAEALARARSLFERLRRGEDFVAVASAESEGPNRSNGGLWKTSPGSYSIPAVNSALMSMPIGQISQVIEGPSSYHIIRVEGRREAGPASFSEVQDDVRKTLHRAKIQKESNAFLDRLRSQTVIESVFGDPNVQRAGTESPAPRR